MMQCIYGRLWKSVRLIYLVYGCCERYAEKLVLRLVLGSCGCLAYSPGHTDKAIAQMSSYLILI